ncbi:Chromatin assembly factor 1 subunit A [Eumeta japonica]|uniref:Chromatin assembly factor 1 subunit A n=1 Tax=Eumeta variegata TaxID=151549 RepID=A0A4C1UKZ5_EUMVA|nr:Chromatin assembly factor 1 subunit A [Eumeta japonica]
MNATEDVIEITPSKKKLKQARLPFKTISDSITTSTTPPLRKRKLSTEHVEKESKVGKLNKKDDCSDTCSEPVVISDDENEDTRDCEQKNYKINPFVKLVDNVWKKKQKSKATKRNKRLKHKASIGDSDTYVNNSVNKKHNDKVQAMEIDEPGEITSMDKNESTENIDKVLTDKTSAHRSCVILEKDKCKNLNVPNNSDLETITVDEDSNSFVNLEEHKTFILKNDNNSVTFNNYKCSNAILQNDSDVKTVTIDEECNNLLELDKQTNLALKDNKPEVSDTTNKNLIMTDIELQNLDSSVGIEECLESESTCESNDKNCSLLFEKHSNSLSSNEKNHSSSNNTDNQGKKEIIVDIVNSRPKNLEKGKVNPSPQEHKLKETNSKDEFNTSSNSSKLGDSTSSNLSTPRRSKRNSDNSKVSLNDSTGSLTPKQLQRKEEFAKKKLEREQEKQEREQKRQQEKEERQRLKREKERKRKGRTKERKRRKNKKREGEKRERKEKEAKEEEKRKKLEAVEQEKQEQELKKKKAAEAFANFFVPKQKVEKDQEHILVSKNSMLSSFTKKADMRLAPIVRAQLNTDQQNELDKQMGVQNCRENDLYLNNLKVGLLRPKSNGKTWPLDDKNDEDDDVMIIEDELPPLDSASEMIESEPTIREKLKPKLLSFHENRRPPYWGTWRKKSNFIKPRKPFGQDEKQLDYEVDSDEEWEEEEGESIDGSVAGSDEEPNEADEYEVDNELFVPHGYLSDEEATVDEDDVLSLSPETQKARLKYLEDEFELELKKPTEKLKTRLYGLLWENSDGGKPELCIESLWNYFSKMAMIVSDPTPLLQPSNDSEETEKKKVKKKKSQIEGEPTTPKTKNKKLKKSGANKETSELEAKNIQSDTKKNQPGINAFLKKIS